MGQNIILGVGHRWACPAPVDQPHLEPFRAPESLSQPLSRQTVDRQPTMWTVWLCANKALLTKAGGGQVSHSVVTTERGWEPEQGQKTAPVSRGAPHPLYTVLLLSDYKHM